MNLLEDTLMSKLIYLIIQQQYNQEKSVRFDTSKVAAKSDLAACLKSKIDKIGVAKLKTL